jgi:uncharacterized membrane protein YraQ (UPF0718 family)
MEPDSNGETGHRVLPPGASRGARGRGRGAGGSPGGKTSWSRAMQRAVRQIATMLPVLLGVILLVGLFKTFVSEAWMNSLFTGRPIVDALFGAAFGSVLAGNPVNSYVIGRGLLDMNVGLAAVTAFILTWVTVGVVQLPAEVAALGLRFALVRAVVAFVLSVPIACLTWWLVRMIS